MSIFPLGGCLIPSRTTLDKRGSFSVHLTRFEIGQEMAQLWYFSPERLRDSIANHMGQRGILGCSFVPKRSKISQEMAELRPRGCVIPLRTIWDKRGSFGVHLYQKDLKLVKKWLSYGQEVA